MSRLPLEAAATYVPLAMSKNISQFLQYAIIILLITGCSALLKLNYYYYSWLSCKRVCFPNTQHSAEKEGWGGSNPSLAAAQHKPVNGIPACNFF